MTTHDHDTTIFESAEPERRRRRRRRLRRLRARGRRGRHRLQRLRRRLERPRRRGDRAPRGAHRRQHGPAAPVDARRAPPHPRARRRDGHRGPRRHRLPAHRHREEHGVPHLGAGRHVLHPDGLPHADVPGDGLLPGHREAARHHRPDPRAGQHHPRADDGAHPDQLPPGLPRHRWHGARRDHRHDRRLPRARAHPARLRGGHRPADEQRLHPPGRGVPGRARTARSTWSARSSPSCAAASTSSSCCSTRTPCSRAAPSASASWTSPAAWRWASPARCCAPPACRTTCASRRPYCGYETYDFDVITRTGCDAYDRLRIRIDEMYESLKIVEQTPRPAAAHRGPAGHGRGQEDRLARPAGHRRRRPGQQPRPHPRDHGHLDGVADPPLQAGHRGLPGPAGPGLRARSSRPRASWAATWSPTAAPAPTGRTSATRASTTCRPWPSMCEGGQVADVIVAVASIDPVMGGVDR